MTAEPAAGRYRAELVARTLGVASWLTGERTQRYVSIMEIGRVRTIAQRQPRIDDSQAQVGESGAIGKSATASITRPAESTRKKVKTVGSTPGLVFVLPPGPTPVDILTGFYNLRAGMYGPLTPGAHLQDSDFYHQGDFDDRCRGADRTGALGHSPFFPAGGTLLRVQVDPEVFDTGDADAVCLV